MNKNSGSIGGNFMRVKIREIGKSLHPNEVLVEIATIGHAQQLVVDKRSIQNSSISVGSPISRDGDTWLVELPRETTNGSWRVWVKNNSLVREDTKGRAA